MPRLCLLDNIIALYISALVVNHQYFSCARPYRNLVLNYLMLDTLLSLAVMLLQATSLLTEYSSLTYCLLYPLLPQEMCTLKCSLKLFKTIPHACFVCI